MFTLHHHRCCGLVIVCLLTSTDLTMAAEGTTQMELRLTGGYSTNADVAQGGRRSGVVKQEFSLAHERAKDDHAFGFALRGSLETFTQARDMDEREIEAKAIFARGTNTAKATLNLTGYVKEDGGKARMSPSALLEVDVLRGSTSFGLGLGLRPVFFRDMDGTHFDLRDQARDYIAFDGEISIRHNFAPSFEMGPILVARRQEPLAEVDFYGLERGNTMIYAGWGFSYNRGKFTLEAEGGYAWRRYDEPLYGSENFWSVEAKAQYKLSDKTELLLNVDTHVDDEPILVFKDTLVRSVGAGISHNFTPKFSATLLYAAEWSTFWGTTLKSLTHTAEGIAEYKITPDLALQLDVTYEYADDTLLAAAADNFKILGGVVLRNQGYKKDDAQGKLSAVSPKARH